VTRSDPNHADGDRPIRRFGWAYLISTSLLVVIGVALFFTVRLALFAHERDTHIASLIQREQALLSQSTEHARAIQRIITDPANSDSGLQHARQLLWDDLESLTYNHRDLRAAIRESQSAPWYYQVFLPHSGALIHEPNQGVSSLRKFAKQLAVANPGRTEQTRDTIERLVSALSENGAIVSGLRKASRRMEETVQQRLDDLKRLHTVGIALLLCGLIGQAGFVVFPLTGRAKRLASRAARTLRTLEAFTNRDALTGLQNRNHFLRQLRERTLSAQTESDDGLLGMMLIEIAQFRAINDLHGTLAGDEVLRTTAQRLKRWVGLESEAARLGADEFGTLVQVDSREDLERKVHEIDHLLRAPILLAHAAIYPNIRLAFGMFPEDGSSPEDLMSNVQLTAQAAKTMHTREPLAFTAQLRRSKDERRRTGHELAGGLATGQVEVHYQPKVAMGARQHIGFEALVRWAHPERGLLLPESFLDVAEEAHLMDALTETVLSQVTSDFSAWRTQGLDPGPIAINIPRSFIQQPDSLTTLEFAINSSADAALSLELEITENVPLHYDAQSIAQWLERVHQLGMTIAFDDFGTGYASLMHLRSFVWDSLKLDQSFVKDIDAHPDSAEMVAALVRIATSMGRQVIAEGVETHAERECLEQCGCVIGQGYLFSHPLPFAEASEYLLALPGPSSVVSIQRRRQ
jgi:diguanylate cyclase (GGDEF)-like protein